MKVITIYSFIDDDHFLARNSKKKNKKMKRNIYSRGVDNNQFNYSTHTHTHMDRYFRFFRRFLGIGHFCLLNKKNASGVTRSFIFFFFFLHVYTNKQGTNQPPIVHRFFSCLIPNNKKKLNFTLKPKSFFVYEETKKQISNQRLRK